MQKANTLDAHVMRRYTQPLPRVVDVHDLTAAPPFPKGPFARLVSRMFLGVSRYVSVQAEEPPIRQIPTRPNKTFIPGGGGV